MYILNHAREDREKYQGHSIKLAYWSWNFFSIASCTSTLPPQSPTPYTTWQPRAECRDLVRALERASLTRPERGKRANSDFRQLPLAAASGCNGFRKPHMIRLPARAAERRERRGDHLMSDRGRQATVGHGERAHAALERGSREGGSVPSIFPLPCQDTEKRGKGWIGLAEGEPARQSMQWRWWRMWLRYSVVI